MKNWNWKKIAIAAGVVLAALVVFDVTGRALFPETWADIDKQNAARKEAQEEQRKQAAAEKANRPAQEKTKGGQPTGAMYMGGIVAIEMANAGAIKPTSDRVNALAREAATKSDVAADDRSRFVRDFEFGFWQGWKTANR
jgi:F0F1-type ATP synthase epsilon subunit